VVVAAIVVLNLAAATLALGWGYFRRYRVTRPPLGVIDLGDVLLMIVGIVLIPYLYLGLPGWLVGAILALGTLGILQLLLDPVLRSPWLVWPVALGLVGADVALAAQAGTASVAFLAVNDLVLALVVVGVTNLWAQSGLRARDLAVLAGALTAYDLIATSLLPLTEDLIARLAGLPFTPVLAWPVGDGRWLGLGLGDLLLATVGPLVFRKAYGRTAGMATFAIALATVAALLLLGATGLLRGTFPVMVVLGPLLVGLYVYWERRRGGERTTRDYLRDEPLGPLLPDRGNG
jgi:hypothetical protein